jgi:tetratricopeptide (TPR) repeat protein
MKNKYVKLLLTAAACSSFMLAVEENVQSINTTVDSFSVDKQKVEATAKSFVVKGNELFFAAQYLEAAKNYSQAAYIYDSLKNNSQYFTDQYNKTREMIAKSYYYMAQETALKAHEQANANDFDKAIALCENAIKIYPASEKEMTQRIETYKKMSIMMNLFMNMLKKCD